MSGDELFRFSSLALVDAVLCANCDMVSNSTGECRCCGSTATMPLAKLLGELRGGSTAKMVEREWSGLHVVPKIMPHRAA